MALLATISVNFNTKIKGEIKGKIYFAGHYKKIFFGKNT